MMYFRGNNFYPFALDWQEKSNDRHVVPGLGIYFLDPKEGNWSIDDIKRQINFTRTHNIAGQGHYRVQYLMQNTQGLYDEVANLFYTYPALQPAMHWLEKQVPTTPKDLKVKEENGYITLNWEPSTDNDPRNAPRYVIYSSDTYPVDTSNPHNIIAQNVRGTEYVYAPLYPWIHKPYFAVSAIDRYGNESTAIQLK